MVTSVDEVTICDGQQVASDFVVPSSSNIPGQ